MSNFMDSLKINKSVLKNRLVLAPMTTCQSNIDGIISEEEILWLLRLAKDGFAMIITCATTISLSATGFKNQLSIADDSKIPGLKHLNEMLAPYDVIRILQLSHAGSRANMEIAQEGPYSASAIPSPMKNNVTPIELSIIQINTIIEDFANACHRAFLAGFNGIEIHGCNGYLITQFISQMTNHRQDRYGGSLENRARLARQVVQACRKVVPQDFIIGFRLTFENSGFETGLDIDENIQVANWLIEDGIDYLHISCNNYNNKSIKYKDKNMILYILNNLKNKVPVIGVGGIKGLNEIDDLLKLNVDLIACGRLAIGNLNLPAKLVDHKELKYTPYTPDSLKEIGLSASFIDYLTNGLSAMHVVDNK